MLFSYHALRPQFLLVERPSISHALDICREEVKSVDSNYKRLEIQLYVSALSVLPGDDTAIKSMRVIAQ